MVLKIKCGICFFGTYQYTQNYDNLTLLEMFEILFLSIKVIKIFVGNQGPLPKINSVSDLKILARRTLNNNKKGFSLFFIWKCHEISFLFFRSIYF
jgi:hypothetical protein